VEVYIGGQLAPRLYTGRAPCCAGLDQMVVRVPEDAPTGCWVPVQVRAGGLTSNAVTMAVAPAGRECSDPWSPLSETIRKGGRLARFLTHRGTFRGDLGFASSFENTIDKAALQVADVPADPFAYQLLDSLPPPGACTVHTMRGHWLLDAQPIPVAAGAAVPVGASVNIRSAISGVLNRLPAVSQVYAELLGADGPLGPVTRLFYSPGQPVMLSAPGEGSVVAFTMSQTPELSSTWPGRDAIQAVDRSRALVLPFPAGPAQDVVFAFGANTNVPRAASAAFLCAASAAAGRVMVPAYVLQAIPVDASGTFPEGVLAIVSHPLSKATRAELPGFRTAISQHVQWHARSVVYR
jgi:hypothetical protein